MTRLRRFVLILIACSACGRLTADLRPTESVTIGSPSPTPFLPRGFVGVGSTPVPVETLPAAEAEAGLDPMSDLGNDVGFALIRLRLAQGLPEVTIDPGLSRLARDAAGGLVGLPDLAHGVDPSGRSSAQVGMSERGFHGALAEVVVSIRQGLDDPVGAALQAWLTDPANRSVLLAEEYRYLGVGAAGDGSWLYLVCALAESGPLDPAAEREDDLDQ